MNNLNEDSLAEQPLIEWFKELDYEYAFGPDIAPGGSFMERNDYRGVILEQRLIRSLTRINPDIPANLLQQIVNEISKFQHSDIELGNKEIYEQLVNGKTIEVKDSTGDVRGKIVQLIDFDNPLNNEFLIINQFSIQGSEHTRKPDVVIFINGIPIAVFELKNPTDPNASIVDAFSQLHDKYKRDIPKLFFYNQMLVASDMIQAKHGTVSATWDFFAPWNGIESENETNSDKSQLEVLTKGIFQKERVLDIIKHFIVFEADSEKDATKYTKKMCMYHQYFGVNSIVNNTLKSIHGEYKIGVYWHTQGSGKSLSMVFYVNKLMELPELAGPTILFLTDRNDLDQQLYKTFLRSNYPTAKIARSINDLKEKLKGAGAEILFTTIQKFDLEEKISDRENIIVIADEAHRSQYAQFAGNVRSALPKASFLGITGTPIAFNDRNTQLVFGKIASKYTIDKSEQDKTTVPIYYDSRLIPLHYANDFIDEDFDNLFEEQPIDMKDEFKKKVATLERLVGADDRLRQVAKDILFHFNHRKIEGKAMIVTMSRKIAVDLYQILKSMPLAPELAVVISKNSDYKGQIQDELSNKELERRFKDPNDPLKLVIVCDMWITGFDVPHLHTLYLDKLLKGHTLMQAIARVNRRYKDKEAGLVVDYIGIADALKKAIAIYTSDIQEQPMVSIEVLVEKMLQKYEEVCDYFQGIDYKNWRELSSVNRASLFNMVVNTLITDKQSGSIDNNNKRKFLQSVNSLSRYFSLVMPHDKALEIRWDVEFFEKIKEAIVKFTSVEPIYVDQKIRLALDDLISQGIVAEGVIKVTSPQDAPNIMILDEKFLEEVKKSRLKNLTIEAITKLLKDELKLKIKSNRNRYLTLLERIEEAIEEYENNIINSAKVIEKLIEIAKEVKEADQEGKDLGLNDDELSFYDSLFEGNKVLKKEELKKLVKELVSAIKRDITIDWTDHEIVKAKIRSNVRFALLRHNISYSELEPLTEKIYQHAKNLYINYPNTMYAQ